MSRYLYACYSNSRIRWRYVLEKTMATFGTFYILYMTTEHYILPKIPETRNSLPRAFLELTFPFLVNYLLIFYIMFECICNAFAEVSMFADRNFYDDWWNSVTFDEFARKWNKPVHHFLLRHVYAYSISTYKLSKNNATFVTFLLSSLLHELVLIVVTKKFRMYLFAFQMLQLPLIAVGRLPAVKNNKVLGNAFFWFGECSLLRYFSIDHRHDVWTAIPLHSLFDHVVAACQSSRATRRNCFIVF